MKFTLLDMTQNILSRMSSDEVNSIGDSSESLQVANIIRNKYYDIITRVHLPEHDQLICLEPSLDTTMPVMMYIPEGTTDIKWIKYFDTNVSGDSNPSGYIHDLNLDVTPSGGTAAAAPPGYKYVTILPVQQFLDMTNSFNPEETAVHSFVFRNDAVGFPGEFTFYYRSDKQPSFCTVIGNYYVIFDSYDSAADSTLQESKTMAWGRVIPTFRMDDTFIPELDEDQFQLLLNESTALAFYELKQQPHALALQEAKRGWSTVQKNKSVSNKPNYFDELPDFGRRGFSFRGWMSPFKARGWDRGS